MGPVSISSNALNAEIQISLIQRCQEEEDSERLESELWPVQRALVLQF